jgi:hypothetical protein
MATEYDRRDFLKLGASVGAGLALGTWCACQGEMGPPQIPIYLF